MYHNNPELEIAICLSTYNGAKYLNEQLLSLTKTSLPLSQLALIVRDDGSQDESYSILQDFSKNTSLHVIFLEDSSNLGIKKSFEFLMQESLKLSVKYIMFCDQDDIWFDNKIEKTYIKMKSLEKEYPQQPLLVHSDLTVVDLNLSVLSPSFWKYQNINPKKDSLNRLLLHNTVTGCTLMINRLLAEKVKNIPKEAIMHDWWIALVATTFGKISYIDAPLMFYRQHGSNDTGAKKYGWSYIVRKFFNKLLFDQYFEQSKALLNQYDSELDIKTKSMLENFSKLNQQNKLQKMIIIFRYQIFKNGFFRNLGLFFLI